MNNHNSNLKDKNSRQLKACMLAYTFYENDGRVMRYAETLANTGADVEAIVLRRETQAVEDVVKGIRVLRIQKREKNESGKYSYLSRVLKFLYCSMIEITRRHLKRPYDIIHVHSIPDFEVFAAFIPKLKGAKIILDIHDIVPEFYAAKFKVNQKSLIFKSLKAVEKLSTNFADHVIIANDLWFEKITARSVSRDKCTAFINYPDFSIFKSNLRTRNDDDERFIMVYPGTLNWHQGLDIAVKAFAIAKENAPNLEFHIYGEGSTRLEIEKLVKDMKLNDRVLIKSPLPLHEIAAVMANADLGVVPKRNDPFGGEAFSTKILEFMAISVPLIIASTKIDKYYFDETLVRFFKAGDEKDLARAMVNAYQDRAFSKQLAAKALEYVRQNSWDNKKKDYLKIVERLVNYPLVAAD